MKFQKFLLVMFILVLSFAGLSCSDKGAEPDNDSSDPNSEIEIIGIPVIFETDMTFDVDDVGALAVLHGLQNEGEVTILGVCYKEVHPLGHFAIDAINTYYNRGRIPIGIYTKNLQDPDPSDYYTYDNGQDLDNMKHDMTDNMLADAIEVYKQLLEPREDSSVVIISVGFLNNLHDLLLDPEGYNLAKSKVKLLAVMGALHYGGFNFTQHGLVDQTQYVIENWPGTLVTTHVGAEIITGETLTARTPENNPVRKAYELELGVGPNNGRSSWDQVTTLYAVFGTKYYVEDWDGGGSLPNGYTWTFRQGFRGYAAPKDDKEVEDEIERLMTLKP